MKAFFISLAKKTAYVIAAIIIITAVVVCFSRALMPVLDQHREDFEKYASKLLQMPVTIKNVRVSWYQYQPVIDFNEVTVLDKETKGPLLQIQKVSLLFSIPKSIWQWKLVPSGIVLVGTDLNLYQTATGEFNIQGFPFLGKFNQRPYKNETKFTDMLTWLSQQPRLILQNIDLSYTPFKGLKRFVTLYHFSVENSDTEHIFLGKAILHQTLPTEVTVSAQWEGQAINLAQIKAKVYVYVSGLALPQWMNGWSWQGWQVNEGIMSAKIWTTWQKGAFQQIQTSFQSYGLKLYSQTDKSIHTINRLSGDLGWKRQEQGQVFAGDDILIDLPAHLWPSTSFYVSLVPGANGVLSPRSVDVGYVDLDDAQAFLFASPLVLPDVVQTLLKGLQLKGNLQNTAITFGEAWSDVGHISLNTNFSQLSFLPWKFVPGIRHLSGAIKWNGTQGALTLNSNRVVVDDSSIFENAINMDQLSADAQWQRGLNKAWTFRVSTLQILNDDAAANMSGSLMVPANAPPVADIQADFTMQKASHIARYLPMRTFAPDLIVWLKEAFLSGEVKSGHIVLRGPLSDFPFDNGNGTFSISGIVNNIDFRYAPDWPLLRNVSGQLAFTGRKMLVNVDHARILGIPVSNVHGAIPYFGKAQPQLLEVESSDIQADLAQGLNFIHSSPLEKNLGKMFRGVDLRGPMVLKLGLTVPLKNPDKTQVRGDLTIKDSVMDLAPWNLKLDHLQGQIQFTENSTQAKNIQGRLFNKPFQFGLATLQKTKKISVVQANFTNHFSIDDLETWLNISLSSVLRGAVDLAGTIDFSLAEPIDIHLRSNLIGTSIDLVGHYEKKPEEARNVSADITVKDKEPLRMKLSYGGSLSAALILERKKNKYNMIGADLRLGGGEATWPPSNGIYITGKIDKLDWDKIKMYSDPSSHSYFSASMLRGIDVHVGQLMLGGRSLTQLHLQATTAQNNWNINISSPDVVGQLKMPIKFNRQAAIVAQFQKIKLHSTAGLSQPSSFVNVKMLPSISFTANEVSYNEMPLGQAIFKATPSTEGLTIQTLRIVSPHIDLHASGKWTQARHGEQTYLQGVATSSRVSDLVNSLGLDVRNFVARNGRLNFKLGWQDAPYAPSLSSMSGSASLNLGQGRIVDIGKENGAKMDLGRMLSIFSLQTIPRRLMFDFSDVFQKGYSFDSVRGDFSILHGDIFTHNLHFEGPVAGVGINGRIGLKNKDYHFILGVTAHVTSSLPVAATLLTGNPLIGLGALAVNTVIGSQVSGVTTYYYAVTGPWNNPAWKPVQSSKRK